MKKYIITLFSSVLIVLLSCNVNDSSSRLFPKEVVLCLDPSTNNPRNSEGDFIQLKDKRILYVYTHFSGGASDHAQASLKGRYSNDNGKTWTTDDIDIVANEGQMNVMSVSLIRLDNDQIALFYLRKNSLDDCVPIMRISTDEANSWSEPVQCIKDSGYYVLNNDRVIQLSSGRIVLPVSLHKSPGVEWSDTGRIMCYYSDDNGKNWICSTEVSNPTGVCVQEPGVIQLQNGDVMMFCRTNAGVQYLSYSKDQCKSWSYFTPGKIVSPLSPASIERIPSTSDLLLVWNENNELEHEYAGRRTPHSIAISKDEGKNWIKLGDIEDDPDGWFCYTAIEFVQDYVLLSYCAGNKTHGGLNRTQISRLKIADLYQR